MVTFAIVSAAVIPNIRSTFEIHALGCRDLRKMGPLAAEWLIDAENAEAAMDEAIRQLREKGADVSKTSFYTQSCTNLKRLLAAGRVRPSTVNVESTEPVEPLTAEDIDYVAVIAAAVEAELDLV
jgi:hypothetical protein